MSDILSEMFVICNQNSKHFMKIPVVCTSPRQSEYIEFNKNASLVVISNVNSGNTRIR